MAMGYVKYSEGNCIDMYRLDNVLDESADFRMCPGANSKVSELQAAHMMPPPEVPEPASQLCAELVILDHLGIIDYSC